MQYSVELSQEARDIRDQFLRDYDFDNAQQLILQSALETFDRMRAAQRVIEDQGMTYTDSKGSPKPRPETLIERDCRALFLRQLRTLGVDLEPVVGR